MKYNINLKVGEKRYNKIIDICHNETLKGNTLSQTELINQAIDEYLSSKNFKEWLKERAKKA